MAGSLQRFIYNTDRDAGGLPYQFIVRLDESVQRLLGNAPIDGLGVTTPVPIRIQKVTPRYIYWEGQTTVGAEKVRRRITVCSPDNTFYQIGGNLTVPCLIGGDLDNIEGFITGSVGEKKQFAPDNNKDTGITDGTNP